MNWKPLFMDRIGRGLKEMAVKANRAIRFLFINTTALCGAIVVEFFVFWHTMANWITLCQTSQGPVSSEELSMAVGGMYIPALLMGLPFALLFSILWVEKMGAALGVPMKGYREWITEERGVKR